MCEDGRWRFGVWQVASSDSLDLVIGKLALEAVARLVRLFCLWHHCAAPRGACVFCSVGG